MSSPNAMAPVIARSSLEIMLDSIRQRDEQPDDLPPALPVRPTSRGRPPSPRRSMLMNLNIESSDSSRRSEDKKEELMLRSDMDVVIRTSIFGSKRVAKVKQVEESPCTTMPEQVSHEKDVQGPNVSDLSTVLLTSAVERGKKAAYGGSINCAINEVAQFEDPRNQTLWGILWVQKNFRRAQACSQYQLLKMAAANLQSFVRGEKVRQSFHVSLKRWRSATIIQKHVRQWFARTSFDEQQKAIIILQSVIRGWLARKYLVLRKGDVDESISHDITKEREMSEDIQTNLYQRPMKDPPEITKDAKFGRHQIHASYLAELQNQIITTEASLREKEEENAILKLRLHDFETRWSNYELRMKSMEETWQKQLTSLQMNLAAARKGHVPEETRKQPEKLEASKVSHCTSQDGISVESQALEDTLAKLPNGPDAMLTRNNDSAHSSVIQLMEEFDQQRNKFNKDAGLLTKMKSEKNGTKTNPYEELQKLKAHFVSWKKDYKMRLKHAKTELLRHDDNHVEKARKKWWCAAGSR